MALPSSTPSVSEFDTRKKRPVTVTKVQTVSDSLLRITLSGECLQELPTYGPTGWAKIFVPTDGGAAEAGRAYTLRHLRAQSREVDIYIVLHEAGPFTTWARTAKVGAQVSFAGPRGGFTVNPKSQWLLLAGDLSALPAIASILEVAPASISVHVLLSVHDESDMALVPPSMRGKCRWTTQGDEELLRMVKDIALPETSGEIWGAGEAVFVRNLRRHLLLERGFDKSCVHCTGYWKQGSQDHRDSAPSV